MAVSDAGNGGNNNECIGGILERNRKHTDHGRGRGRRIRETGAEADVMEVGSADAAALAGQKAFALGCPSMGAEQLEETEMEPFVEELEPLVSGRTILLFGSYGWGDGEWMRDWAERMKNAGAVLIRGEWNHR